MPRGLDHIVHAVRDLDAAGERYGRLGFTVGPRNAHPWGTHNRIVQFPGFFIELLTLAEPDKLSAPKPRVFSFGAFNRAFLDRHEGFSMLVLESRDAAADAQAFRDAGIGDFDVFRFERQGRRPDGTPVQLGFSLAFAEDRRAPEASFFACQQHFPENFWNPAFQAHPNTAAGVAGVVLVAENPADHRDFLSAFTGQSELEAGSTGITVPTPRGAVQAMDPESYRANFAVEPPEGAGGARLAALRLAVRDIGAVRRAVRAAGVAAHERTGRVIVPSGEAHGATLVFEAAPEAGSAARPPS